MKVTDMDRDNTSLSPSEMPPDREWLRLVGAGIGIVIICAIWTFWG